MSKASNVESSPRVPRLHVGCDVRSLPITPRDAFLLSRVDGSANEADIASMTGFDYETVRIGVDRLVGLGALDLQGAEPLARPANPKSALRTPPAPIGHASQTHMKSVIGDPREQDEPSDLDPDRRRKVLELYASLSERDFYALLGVPETAEKKEIRRAYYALAPDYHPDKFFGKNLGSFKAKMEAIFAQFTAAYETLSSLDRRTEYDVYLTSQRQARSMEELLTPPPRTTPTPPAEARPSVPPGSGPPRSQDDRARRLAFAKKLGAGRSSIPPEGRPSTAPPRSSQAGAAAAALDLKRRREAFIDESRRSQIRRYVDSAESALKENPAAAANAYRLALTIDPNNPEIIAGHEQASKLAAVALGGAYLKQAEYEARSGHWIEAARSYARAAAGMPDDPAVLHKAAHALLKSGGDLRKAGEFAKRAVAGAPARLEARLTLVEVYLAAGMPLGARRELEAARELAPRDERIAELSKRLR